MKSKEEEIRKILNAGFQMDYDEDDNLVDVFKNEEVVDDLLFYFEVLHKKECIEYQKFLFKTNVADERLYTQFLQSKQITND